MVHLAALTWLRALSVPTFAEFGCRGIPVSHRVLVVQPAFSAIMSSQAFAVNFLSSSGQAASQIFASKATDKFARFAWQSSAVAEGAPLLVDIALSYAERRVESAMEVSDHWLIVARVEGTAVFPREPLLYRRGDYGVWAPQNADAEELSAF